jgi:tetratricopeptide (TPR) repeat protein
MYSKLQIYCSNLIESCWLAAAVTIPLFFNISSIQMFERDKALILKLLALLSSAAFLLKWIDARPLAQNSAGGKKQTGLLRLPMVVPVLALVAVHILSSLFSILPSQSWWGLYERAQGTVVFSCYAILCLIVILELRTVSQLWRLQYAFVLTSLPIAAYTILQFFGWDPLPWGNEVQGRSSGSMGNPIFLGAYLAMIVPLTLSRLWDSLRIAREGDERKHSRSLAWFYAAILAIQLSALLCTQSRGPLLGLAAGGYICVFVLLVLKRMPSRDRRIFPLIAALSGFAAPLLIILIIRIAPRLPMRFGLALLGAGVAGIIVSYLMLWRKPYGKNWLWLTWLMQTAVVLLVIAIGPARIIGNNTARLPQLGRLTLLSNETVDIRRFLWQTGMMAIKSGSPATLPGGIRDSYHSLRPMIGYGPESIGVAANLHAVPGLVSFHVNSTVDRLHNETLDNLISVGFAGAFVYFFIIAAAIFYSLRYLGFLGDKRDILLFTVFLISGSGAGVILPWLAHFPYMAGIGVHLGLLIGLMAFIGWHGCRRLPGNFTGNSRQILALCILCALIAHFVEIAVGIAVTTTRTYFFILIAIVSVLASGEVEEQKGISAKQRNSKSLSWYQSAWMPLAAIASLVVLIEAWCFVINTTSEGSAFALFIKTWFIQSGEHRFSLPFPSILIVMVLTICGGLWLMYAERQNLGSAGFGFGKQVRVSAAIFVSLWLVMGISAAFFWTTLEPSESTAINVAGHAEARLTFFLVGLLLLLFAMAFSIVASELQRYKQVAAVQLRWSSLSLLLIIPVVVLIIGLTVRTVWADMTCRIANSYGKSGDFKNAAFLYERSVRFAPHIISYRIALGHAQSRLDASSAGMQEASEETLRDAFNLNPFDPGINRALGSLYIRFAGEAAERAVREVQVHRAIPFFQHASRLAPNYPEAYNELGRCYFLLGDYEKANSLYRRSLQLYPSYPRTYLYLGEMQYRRKDLEGALKSYSKAIDLEWFNLEAIKNAGFLLDQLGQRQEAIQMNLRGLSVAPKDSVLLRRNASLSFGAGDYDSGISYARRAYDVMPAAERGNLDAFIEQLKREGN